jgi:integrase
LMAIAIAKRISFLRSSHQGLNLDYAQLNSNFLSDLTPEDLEPLTQNARRKVLQEWKRMEMLGHLGLWSDVPTLSVRSLAQAMTGPVRYSEAPPKRNAHLPLPDDYVAQLGSRGLWLIFDLAPNLLKIGEQFVHVWELTDKPHLAPDTIRNTRSNAAREILENFKWRDSKGTLIEKPPFALYLPKAHGFGARGDRGDEAGEHRWPPRNYRDFMGLAGALQAAHLTVGLLSMGPRRSEILSLERSCVAYAPDGRRYADGRTFKLVERHEGELRDWLLPEVAVTAFEQQVRLVTLCEKVSSLSPQAVAQPEIEPGARHLWGRISAAYMSDANVPLTDVNPTLISYARMLGLDIAPGGQNLRSHRFRKTLARLVALALTQAPRLLMEIFGHRSLEMTLYYILADKELRAEIETVSRELRIMRATTVVEKMVEADVVAGDELGGYGGPAAASIHKAIEVQRQQMHRQGKDWEISSTAELAELLTLQGTAWEQVRPGVICTKFPGESGPCNRSKGRPEPSKCRTDCGHRLEEAFLREDINGAIHDSLAAYAQAIADNESLTASHWAAQIRAHVPRFRDLQKKWMGHPTVKALMGGDDLKATV